MSKRETDPHLAMHAAHAYVDRAIILLLVKNGLVSASQAIGLLRNSANQFAREDMPIHARMLNDLADTLEPLALEENPQQKQ